MPDRIDLDLNRKNYNDLVDFVALQVDVDQQKEVINGAFQHLSNLPLMINRSNNPRTFASNLISTLKTYGATNTEHTIILLLGEIRGRIGSNDQKKLDDLLYRLTGGDLGKPLADDSDDDSDSGANPPDPPAPKGGGGGSITNIHVEGDFHAGNVNTGNQTTHGNQTSSVGGGGSPSEPAKQSTSSPPPTESIDPQPFEPGARDHVFISYSHDDKEWMQQLMVELEPLITAKQIKVWTDELIKPGDNWDAKIKQGMQRTRVAVMLISKTFVGSEYIMENEYPTLMQGVKAGEVGLIWVPITRSLYEAVAPDLKVYQAAWEPNKPLDRLDKHELEDAWHEIVQAIYDAYNSLAN